MYQLVIEDKEHGVRYVSSLALTEDELRSQGADAFMRAEHFLKFPDDTFLDEELQEAIFNNVRIIGVISNGLIGVEEFDK